MGHRAPSPLSISAPSAPPSPQSGTSLSHVLIPPQFFSRPPGCAPAPPASAKESRPLSEGMEARSAGASSDPVGPPESLLPGTPGAGLVGATSRASPVRRPLPAPRAGKWGSRPRRHCQCGCILNTQTRFSLPCLRPSLILTLHSPTSISSSPLGFSTQTSLAALLLCFVPLFLSFFL